MGITLKGWYDYHDTEGIDLQDGCIAYNKLNHGYMLRMRGKWYGLDYADKIEGSLIDALALMLTLTPEAKQKAVRNIAIGFAYETQHGRDFLRITEWKTLTHKTTAKDYEKNDDFGLF